MNVYEIVLLGSQIPPNIYKYYVTTAIASLSFGRYFDIYISGKHLACEAQNGQPLAQKLRHKWIPGGLQHLYEGRGRQVEGYIGLGLLSRCLRAGWADSYCSALPLNVNP